MWENSSGSHPWLNSLNYSSYTLFNASFVLDKATNHTGDFEPNNASVATTFPESCIPPSINEFPNDFFTDEQRLNGGIIVNALIVAYVCAMLAIVCEHYFVPSLRVICKYFNVPPDVAGATFMAVGASSPELFSSVIGAFVAKGDIGVGTVVGSAVFNMLGVTGVSGLALGTLTVQLDWYPITRDCFVYVITVASLVIVIHDNLVTWFEASCLLLMFLCYVILLYFNDGVRKITVKLVVAVRSLWHKESDYRLHKVRKSFVSSETTPLTIPTGSLKHDSYRTHECDSACPSSETSGFTESSSSDCEVGMKRDSLTKTEIFYASLDEAVKSHRPEERSLFVAPTSKRGKIMWILMWPANALFRITIPSCTTEKKLKWFPLTFFSSILWLGILSYVSFWMVAYIGYTFGIPDTVSGITILAAGTSVPELVASIIVVKSGMANMAVSNLIGSNIFDILFCLGLPWLVKALLNAKTHSLVINSSALTYTSLILLSNVVLFYFALFVCKWKLGVRMGLISLTLYAVFLVLASLYESNVFGDFNPATCAPSA